MLSLEKKFQSGKQFCHNCKQNGPLSWGTFVFSDDYLEVVARRCSLKKVFLEISQNSQENTCARVSFLIKLQASGLNFIKRETLAQVFSCEFCNISMNTFSDKTPLVADSGLFLFLLCYACLCVDFDLAICTG